jgi:glycogen operon protein
VHWLGGDELSHTLQGNNNAYCQDNEISWLNWQLDYQATQFLQFVKKMISLRQQFSCLQQLSLLDDQYQLHGDKHQVSWYLSDGSIKQDEHWTDPYRTSCIFVIEHLKDHQAMLVIINAGDLPLQVDLPKKSWQLLLDTQFDSGEALEKAAIRTRYVQSERSLSIWS